MKTGDKKAAQITIDTDRCKGCGLCIIYCTKKVLAKSKTLNKIGYNSITVENPDKCNSCGTCYIMCPDYAIEIK